MNANRWYIYYTAGTRTNLDGQRSHVLRGGVSPFDDPYVYAGRLTSSWGIDGTILRISSSSNTTSSTSPSVPSIHTGTERLYFVYSCFPRPKHQSLCIAPMSSPTSLYPNGDMAAHKVLSEPLLPWERVRNPVNEGAAAMYRGGKVFVAYSASDCWSDSYQLGLLTYRGEGRDPLLKESWVKTGPVFSSAGGNWGTGHNGFVSTFYQLFLSLDWLVLSEVADLT